MSHIPPKQAHVPLSTPDPIPNSNSKTPTDRLSLPSASLAYTDALALNRLYAGPRTADWVAQSIEQPPLLTRYAYERTPPPVCRRSLLAPSPEIAEPRRPYFPTPIPPSTRTPSSPRTPPTTYILTPVPPHTTTIVDDTPTRQRNTRGMSWISEKVKHLWKKGTGIFRREKPKPEQPQPFTFFDLVSLMVCLSFPCIWIEPDGCCQCLTIILLSCTPCIGLFAICSWASEKIKEKVRARRAEDGGKEGKDVSLV